MQRNETGRLVKCFPNEGYGGLCVQEVEIKDKIEIKAKDKDKDKVKDKVKAKVEVKVEVKIKVERVF